MRNVIACRIASYGKYQHRAWDHLPQIGISHVEVAYPGPEGVAELARRLADSGLACVSMHDSCQVDDPAAVEDAKPRLDAAAQLGARICFFSAKANGDVDAAAFDRLRRIGQEASRRGLIVSLETHPPLVTNGSVGRATMRKIDHPNVRINYDTANVYFYNQGADAVEELEKLIEYVASVHLKDTNGGYRQWHFPALGEGVVDFPAIFAALGRRGFDGPYTIELEGIEGVELDEAGQLAQIGRSVEYLRSIGAFGQ